MTSNKFSNNKSRSDSSTGKNSTNTNQLKYKEDKKFVPPIEHVIYKYSNNNVGSLYESVLITNVGYFLKIKDGIIKLNEKIEQSEKSMLIPPQDKTSYLSKPDSFSSVDEIQAHVRIAKKENMSTLFKRLKRIWIKYFDNDNNALNICSAYTLFTYFQDRLGMTHDLLFVGDNSTGKSNALRIFYRLVYHPVFDIDITPVNIYNFLGRIEEGHGIILEDEIDNIEDQYEKMKIYKWGYITGTKVTRLYESSNSVKSSKKQQSFLTFSFKSFTSEKNPSFFKAKEFNERLLVINCASGNPQYDISEIESNAGKTPLKIIYINKTRWFCDSCTRSHQIRFS